MKEKVPVELLDKIDGFWDSIKKLEKIHDLGVKEFVKNKFLADLGERNAHYAIDSLLEVAKYLLRKQEIDDRELLSALRKKRVLHRDHAEIFKEILKFRKALLSSSRAKEYVPISAEEIYHGLMRIREKLKFLMQLLSAKLPQFP